MFNHFINALLVTIKYLLMLSIFIKGSNRTLILIQKKDKKEKYILIFSKFMIHVSRDSKKATYNLCYVLLRY